MKTTIKRLEEFCAIRGGSRMRHRLAMAMLSVMYLTATASAQIPALNITEESGGMVDWAVAAGLAVVVCGAGFWNPKRSHQN